MKSVASDGNVTNEELNFLKSAIGDPTTAMPEHVRNLAGKVINGDRANASMLNGFWTLDAGRTGHALSRLVDEWFLGADDSKPWWPGDRVGWYNTMIEQMVNGKTIVVATKSDGDHAHDKIVPSHVYSIVSISSDGRRITLSNPWRNNFDESRKDADRTGDLGMGLIEISREDFIDYIVSFSFV